MEIMEPNNNHLPYTQETPYFDPFGTFYPNATLEPGWEQIPYDWRTLESTIDYNADLDLSPNSVYYTTPSVTTGLLPRHSESLQNSYDLPMDNQISFLEMDEFLDFNSHQDSPKWSTATTYSTTSTPPSQTPTISNSLPTPTTTSFRSLSSISVSPSSSQPPKPIYVCPDCAKPYTARHLLK